MTHDELVSAFRRQFGAAPSVVVRAPGRVNLIGEHTDYNGLPVLPMAIDRCVWVAAARRDDHTVLLANAAPTFAARSYELGESIEPFPAGDWGNYHKAAAQRLLSLLGRGALRGGAFLVAGDIPAGAGLSSSSALVVGSALALLAVNEAELPARELAELTADAERYVGTLSGGMDQAVCLLARAGHALRIDFQPLRSRLVRIPDGGAFVVCDSLVTAEKSGAARAAYNRRVHECRLAARVLGKALASELAQPLRNLGELVRLFPRRALSDFVPVLSRILPAGPKTLPEIARIVGTTGEELGKSVGIPKGEMGEYPVLSRARHVLTEADRVAEAECVLAAGNWPRFGALMDASHASCRDDYQVSCDELEQLVAAAKAAGALGARLTGAGFGGCTVNLVPADRVVQFVDYVERSYYGARREAMPGEHLWVVTPSEGAKVTRV